MFSKDPSHRAGYRNARRLGFRIIEERMFSVDKLQDRPGSNGWIETYSRLFDLGWGGGLAQGEMAFYHQYCDTEIHPLPVRMSWLSRAWFYAYYTIAYKIYRTRLLRGRRIRYWWLKRTTTYGVDAQLQADCKDR